MIGIIWFIGLLAFAFIVKALGDHIAQETASRVVDMLEAHKSSKSDSWE